MGRKVHKMKQKDYEAMAEALRNTYKQAETTKEIVLVERLIIYLTDLYNEEDESFDEEKFMALAFG